MEGRVLAAVDSWLNGGALDHKWESFIFGAELEAEGGKKVVVPVEIAYAYFMYEGPLRESFFDHSKVYELRVTQECGGDQTVNDLAYEKVVDATTGKPLPPIKVLRLLAGAPTNLLKPDLVLPCYVLWSDGYKVVSQDEQPPGAFKSSTAKPKGGTSQP
jgi:hypothetical protein